MTSKTRKKVLTSTTERAKIIGDGASAITFRFKIRQPWQLFL
jgi:hypothetical protein